MGVGKAVARTAAIGAAIAGAVFFWRKHKESAAPAPAEGTFPPAADIPPEPSA